MMSRFEEIRAWQEARKLTQSVYFISDTGALSKDFALRDQMRRAAVAIMSNIAEGYDCESPKEFARFLELSRRAVVEVQSLLYVALDAKYIEMEQFHNCYRQASETKLLIHALRRSVLNQKKD